MASEGLDAYVVTRARTRPVVEGFIHEFVDVDRAWHRADEQLMLLPRHGTPLDLADYDWEPSVSLGHVVDRGMDRPWRAFFVSNLATRDARFGSATIGFTSDGCLVAGLETKTLEDATTWLRTLAEQLDAEIGAVTMRAPWFTLADADAAITAGWPQVHVRWSRGMGDPDVLVPGDIPER